MQTSTVHYKMIQYTTQYTVLVPNTQYAIHSTQQTVHIALLWAHSMQYTVHGILSTREHDVYVVHSAQ